VENLKSGEKLDSVFVYAPKLDDYVDIANMLKDYDIQIPSISS